MKTCKTCKNPRKSHNFQSMATVSAPSVNFAIPQDIGQYIRTILTFGKNTENAGKNEKRFLIL